MAKKTVYATDEFLKLRWEWYAKLKKSGFKDIEYQDQATGNPLPVLRGYSAMDAKRFYRADAAEYYRLAEHHILSVKKRYGASSWEVRAWEAHSLGYGVAKIYRRRRLAEHTSLGGLKRFIDYEKSVMLKDQSIDDIEA